MIKYYLGLFILIIIGMWEDGLGFEGDDGNEITDPAAPQLRVKS